jgi:hypothetical protein
MASYQEPYQSADSHPPHAPSWSAGTGPQDAPPYGQMPAPPQPPYPGPFPSPSPYPGQVPGPPQPPYPGQVQHAFQPHPFAEPQPYTLPPPMLYDARPDSSPGLGYDAYGYPMRDPGESGKARAALWIGILGGWLPVNAFVALAAVAETGRGRKRGRDKAVIGLCCSLVWLVLLGGVAFAVRQHHVQSPPAAPRRTVAAAGADPGCWAGASAVFAYEGSGGGTGAQQTLGNALISAGGKSSIAGQQLRRLGLDYLALAHGAAAPGLAADAGTLSRLCGLSFKAD